VTLQRAVKAAALEQNMQFSTVLFVGACLVAASWAAARRRGRRQRMVNAAAVWVAGQAQAAGGEQRVPLLQGLVGTGGYAHVTLQGAVLLSPLSVRAWGPVPPAPCLYL
jgi:hypothetical protein